jgi:hypothetical protein
MQLEPSSKISQIVFHSKVLCQARINYDSLGIPMAH